MRERKIKQERDLINEMVCRDGECGQESPLEEVILNRNLKKKNEGKSSTEEKQG